MKPNKQHVILEDEVSYYMEERPWGNFVIVHENEFCKVKKITVYPHQRLSLQSHKLRKEQWTVIEGVLGLDYGKTLDSIETKYIFAGDEYTIPYEGIHRAFNDTSKDVVFLEIQTGTYFGEDDIIRYEDDYER